VFQLPVVSYPEEPPPGVMGDYEHLLPSLVSPAGLHWSYGAIRGTARGDWQLTLPIEDQDRLLEDLASAGFCAVEIDRDGYAGASDPTTATEAALGAPIATAASSHLAAFDLRPLTTSLRASLGDTGLEQRRERVLRPVLASVNGSLVDTTGSTPFQWAGGVSTVTVSNMGTEPVQVTLALEVTGVGPAVRRVTATSPGVGPGTQEVSSNHAESLSMPLRVPPGRTLVELTTTGKSTTVPGTEGRVTADLKLADMKLTATAAAPNMAALQQFAAASPRSLR
jgi:hypothetical protein